MIVVDTNVISEPISLRPNKTVVRWLDRQRAPDLFLASTSLAEALTGIMLLPDGPRKTGLLNGLEGIVVGRFGDRILPFDERAARAYARIYSQARARGIAISMPDCEIAAIAETNGCAVATRDVKPFRGFGLRVINPWDEDA
jgi:predicted nucleic acid-binding protein